MKLTDAEFEQIIRLITQKTGIIPRESHRTGIRRYAEERLDTLDCKSFASDYAAFLSQNSDELLRLINSSTVNETYFFREERQFDFLKEQVLPAKRDGGVRLWSAACSSGEEMYSLGLLAAYCKVPAELTASDINTSMLQKTKQGVYGANSVRRVDGAKYQPLLAKCRKSDGTYEMPRDMADSIQTIQLNLAAIDRSLLPKNQDVIFIRNVFIYFSPELRKQILATLADCSLAPGGYLFVSMNEVASIDSSIIPPGLKKAVTGNVFHFRKA